MITPGPRSVPLWLVIPSAICLSALVGWLDYQADEVQGTVLLLLILTGALSFAAPTRVWIIAPIMGLSVMGAYVVGRALGVPPTFAMSPPASGLIALIPAAIGAAAGVAARAAIRSLTTQ